jgi:hypothetical protein
VVIPSAMELLWLSIALRALVEEKGGPGVREFIGILIPRLMEERVTVTRVALGNVSLY